MHGFARAQPRWLSAPNLRGLPATELPPPRSARSAAAPSTRRGDDTSDTYAGTWAVSGGGGGTPKNTPDELTMDPVVLAP